MRTASHSRLLSMFELTSKSFYKRTFYLMIPVVLQQLITVGINFADTVMIGGFGETQIAAASFGNQFYSLFQFICMGLGSGAVVLSSQFWGRKEIEPMRRVAAIAMQLTLALCVLFTVVSVGFPHWIMRVFSSETAVITVGSPYMRLIGVTFLLAGLSSTATYLLRSVGNVRVSLVSSAIAFVLNLFFNWVFIFGKLGAPKLELVGAAVGTIIARVFEFCLVFGYFVLRDKRFGFRLRHFLLSGGSLWRSYFKFGLPVLISDTLLGLSLTVSGMITGHVGEAAAAATSIVFNAIKLTDVLNVGMAGASAIVIGNTIGEGDIPRARREGNTYMLLSFLFGLAVIVPLILLERPYLSLYDVAPATLAMVHGMLVYNYIWMPVQTNAYVSSKGVLRGGGDTRFILVADSSLIWFFSIPVGAVAGLIFRADPVIVYIILRIQLPMKGFVCFFRYITGKWIKVITAKPEEQ